MPNRLFIAEKPDQGRKIAEAIGVKRKGDQHLVCADGSVVSWCFGHLIEPKYPEEYDEELKPWRWQTLPIVPKPFKFKPRSAGAGKQLKIIAGLLRDASEVVVATDADREGEMIGREVLTWLGYKGAVRRLWITDLNAPAVRKALDDIRPGDATAPLYHAALARACADWLVGFNMTRAATMKLRAPIKGGKPFSVGRVQTPTLALVVRLERKIRDFKPEAYYELVAQVDTETGKQVTMRFAPPPEKRIKDPERIEKGRRMAEGQSAPISRETHEKKQAPPELFDLTLLQRQANQRFGFSADRTLKLAQALYETHNVLTYPRTDGKVLPEEHAGQAAKIIGNLVALPDLAHLAGQLADPLIRPKVYNDKILAKHSHHAIVPTLKPCDPAALSADELKLYMLVARTFLASHLPDYEYLATSLKMTAGGVPFRTSGTVPTKPGWKSAFQGVPEAKDDDAEEPEDAGELPDVRDGEIGTATKVEAQKKMTKEPSRFTEATLLRAMRKVADHVDDPEKKKRLKETSGIGTVATQGNIIETLKKRAFIEVRKKKIHPTESGMGLIAALEASLPHYADPAQTAVWEDFLEEIAQGSKSTADFVAKIAGRVSDDVAFLKEAADLPLYGPNGETVDRARFAEAGRGPAAGGDWKARRKEAAQKGARLKVPYEAREEAKAMGAIWIPDLKAWVLHPDTDPAPFARKGWIAKAD